MKKQIINWYNLPTRIHSLSLTKQDKLTAGSNIQIEGNVISAESMVEITHADLLALVNSNSLVAGQQRVELKMIQVYTYCRRETTYSL